MLTSKQTKIFYVYVQHVAPFIVDFPINPEFSRIFHEDLPSPPLITQDSAGSPRHRPHNGAPGTALLLRWLNSGWQVGFTTEKTRFKSTCQEWVARWLRHTCLYSIICFFFWSCLQRPWAHRPWLMGGTVAEPNLDHSPLDQHLGLSNHELQLVSLSTKVGHKSSRPNLYFPNVIHLEQIPPK